MVLHRHRIPVLAIVTVAGLVLVACGATPTTVPTAAPTQPPQATKAPPTAAPTAAPTKVPPTATKVPPTPTPGPVVGGKLVWALSDEPDTLDPHKSGMASMLFVHTLLSDTLIARDPATGKYVSYLAESWKISDDGTDWEFKLRKDVKFHDGTPLKASDYAFTFKRALDPATKSPLVGLIASISEVTAPDDSTLKLKLKQPSAPLLLVLMSKYRGPVPQAAVEKMGGQYGRAPVSTGPYKFKEWRTGDRITVEINPDYKWAPPFIKRGPYIQTVEYRIIPDVATRVAGMEAGEIDLEIIQAKDLERLKATGRIHILEYLQAGGSPSMLFNCSKAPFDDVRVRQAFMYAIDKQNAIKAVVLGQAAEQNLPASATMTGWWAEGEKTLGYRFDLTKAKALMNEAGYTPGADGILQKDGKPLKVTLHTGIDPRLAEVLVEQYKALGAAVSIVSIEWGKALADIFAGNFDFCTFSYLSSDFDLIVAGWGSKAINGIDLAKANDTALDPLLLATRTTVDPAKRQAAMETAQKYILDKVYIGPLYAPKVFWGVSNRVKNLTLSPVTTEIWFHEAYITTK